MTPNLVPGCFANGTPLTEGRQYGLIIGHGREWPGSIFAEPGVVRWHYTTEPKCYPASVLNLIHGKPHFVLSEADGREVLRVRRTTRFPPHFEIVENGEVVGHITRPGLLRIHYRLELATGVVWTLHLRLFRTLFRTEASSGEEIRVLVGPSKQQWNLLTSPGADTLPLLGTLAFIHREWWSYG